MVIMVPEPHRATVLMCTPAPLLGPTLSAPLLVQNTSVAAPLLVAGPILLAGTRAPITMQGRAFLPIPIAPIMFQEHRECQRPCRAPQCHCSLTEFGVIPKESPTQPQAQSITVNPESPQIVGLSEGEIFRVRDPELVQLLLIAEEQLDYDSFTLALPSVTQAPLWGSLLRRLLPALRLGHKSRL